MSGSAKLSTVIFDMDGCLIDTEQAYIQAWAHAFEVKGIPIASEELISWAGTGKNEINDIVTGIVGSRELAMELRQIREDSVKERKSSQNRGVDTKNRLT